MLNKKRTTGDF